MTAYVLRRLLLTIPVLLAIVTLVFAIRPLVPGDPVQIMFFGQSANPEVVANIRKQLGLDKSIPEQYLMYVGNVLHGDLGTSITTRRPVMEEIASRYPATLELAVGAFLVSVAVGLASGIVAALHKDSPIDTLAMVVATAGISMPAFWFGLLAIYFFSVRLGWFAVIPDGSFKSLILPATTLGLIASSIVARLVRSAMLEVLSQEYVQTARAKGLTERRVVIQHALRNAAIPVVTIAGLQFGGLLTGAFIIEVVFAWHGIGELAVQAFAKRDFPMIQGVTIVVATTYVLVNLAVDVICALLDPRVSYR
ncbi:MAG TPA: ABC transporter permease [Thermomicrobiales bacterium]|nr:ABC transporter permease [Thermomicrobiales bacterium]